MPSRAAELASALEAALGGTVEGLVRLSGGASRVTSRFDLVRPDGSRRHLILQQRRGDPGAQGSAVPVETALLEAAADAGVPAPAVVASGERDGLEPGWLVVERLEGETIPRRILRDDEWATARRELTAQCGSALAAIHSIDPERVPGLAPKDPLRDPLIFLDTLGESRPVLELGARWLSVNEVPSTRRVTVHGDFRMGNLLVDHGGLRAVLDWELSHVGDPAEDVGWLCARSWRFGGPGEVGGFGTLDELLAAYEAAGGEAIDSARVTWWQAYATVKWAVICALQASAHLGGTTRSVELATIGRRVCENEWDLLCLIGAATGEFEEPSGAAPAPTAPFGRPSAFELVEAVREHLDRALAAEGDASGRFEARVARNALAIVEREMVLGPAVAAAHAERVRGLGFSSDAELARAIRSGEFDGRLLELGGVLAGSARDQVAVANPGYLSR